MVCISTSTLLLALYFPYLFLISRISKTGGIFWIVLVYFILLHLPPLRFYCVTSLTSVSFTVFPSPNVHTFLPLPSHSSSFPLSPYLPPPLLLAHLKTVFFSFSSLLFLLAEFKKKPDSNLVLKIRKTRKLESICE